MTKHFALLFLFGSNSENMDPGQDYSKLGYVVVLGLSALYFLLSAISLNWVKTGPATNGTSPTGTIPSY